MSAILLALLLEGASPAAPPAPPYAVPGEDSVDRYMVSARNIGAGPFTGDSMARTFKGQAGIRRIVDRMVADAYKDRVIGEIFQGHDKVRLTRTLFEHFCAILNAGCTYSGRDMAASHKDLGVQQADMNRLVEILQRAMKAEGVPFAAQNRFLSKLVPMRKDVVAR
jgi:hemoglobin